MKKAFTLAEVLITLGIIGVVAAMTMPTLVQNYQKKVTATRLEHFSSLMQQATRLRTNDAINGNFHELDTTEVAAFNPDDMKKFFNIYWKPYVKTISTKKLTRGLAVKFANGSGAYFQRNYVCPSPADPTCNTYMLFCTHYKYCEAIDEKTEWWKAMDGHHLFEFWQNGRAPYKDGDEYFTRDEVLTSCKTSWTKCASLIEIDGWTIKDDYPW